MTAPAYRTAILPGLGPVLVPETLSDAEVMRDLIAETPALARAGTPGKPKAGRPED